MNIIFFTHYFPPEGNAPASRTFEHCKRWVTAGHSVTVITCVPNVPDGVVYDGFQNRIRPQKEVIDGINVIRTWTYVAANARAGKRIVNYVSFMLSSLMSFLFLCKRPDVIVATSPQLFCGLAGVMAAYIKRCPFVLEVRDIWPESIVTVGAMKKGVLLRILESIEKWMYRSADHIVTVGNGYRDNIVAKVGRADQISVVTNGVDSELFSPQEPSTKFRAKHGLENRFVCSYVGTIGMAHGLSIVVRAAEKLREARREDIVFCLVGDGAYRSFIEKEIMAADVGSLVRLTGRLPKSEMPTVLASSDCLLVHLKKTDLFQTVIPSKIFETMAMKRPLIMGVSGESADIVEASESGILIEPENETELVDAVVHLCDSPGQYQQLCVNGRDYVSAKFSRDKLAAKMLAVIERVALGVSK